MKIKSIFYCFISIIFYSSCTVEHKSLESEQNKFEDYRFIGEVNNTEDSLIFLKGEITKDFLGENNKLSLSDSCLFFLPKYYDNNLMFYSGTFQGEGLITILYKLGTVFK